ncbi:hypothetical protein tinsulaeT_02950 [Thalassotalea insulae]|uniref:Lipoprotein n=1 Tax=Thalassotalea insulae TaxID=2056778 RepID=A0ABQ6GQH7_9GAMM|nr:hypothetical protein [Thalassotalea insulae]GLX76955.1 hypothetical protein tinsulaeT_02950 [Thalassotalea insulae]
MLLAMIRVVSVLGLLFVNGCAVVTATVGVAAAVVEGTVEVVDAVTPDIVSDEQEDND